MKLRYLINKDTTKKLYFEANNKEELKHALLSLFKKSIKEGVRIDIRLHDVALIGYKGDKELADLYVKSVLRGHHAKGIYKSAFLLRQGKRGSYNDCHAKDSFGGLGVHLGIFDTCIQTKYFDVMDNQDIIDAIRETC